MRMRVMGGRVRVGMMRMRVMGGREGEGRDDEDDGDGREGEGGASYVQSCEVFSLLCGV